MKLLTPQEIEVWYILPAIRKEFAKIIISKGLTQKEAAKRLHLTEPAISQYLKDKRGKDVKFTDKVKNEMKVSVETIMSSKNPHTVIFELQRILSITKQEMIVCEVHRKIDDGIPSNCNQCLKFWK